MTNEMKKCYDKCFDDITVKKSRRIFVLFCFVEGTVAWGGCKVVSCTLTCYTEVTENRDIDCVFLRYWSVESSAY